jgi:Protein of unknown function (DUF2934)
MVAQQSRLESQTLHQKIAVRAYAIWEEQGWPHGCDLAHWLQAEAEIGPLKQADVEPAAAMRSVRKARSKRRQLSLS